MRTVERHPDAVDALVEEELVVMNVNSLDYFRFSEVAKAIWELLGSGQLVEADICRALMVEYEVTEDECQKAVADFIDDAISRGFLRVVQEQ